MVSIDLHRLGVKMTVAECCKELGISRRTWYNRVAEVE
jgi:hypothetical protein